VLRADALDPVSCAPPVEGGDAVLSRHRRGRPARPRKPASTSARAAVEAMNRRGVKRIVVVSAAR